jgi:predicted KAP-like P-loop ATPase
LQIGLCIGDDYGERQDDGDCGGVATVEVCWGGEKIMWADTESSVDYLNFGEIAEIVSDIISNPAMLPVSVGILGKWGSGKSSILNFTKKELEKEQDKYIIIHFDSWLYQGYDDARLALMEKIISNIQDSIPVQDKVKEKLLDKIKNLRGRINYFRVAGIIGEVIAFAHGIPTGGMIAKGMSALSTVKNGVKTESDYKSVTEAADGIKSEIGSLVNPSQDNTPSQHIDGFRKEYGEIITELKKTIVVIIDNLDRCSPANAIQTLEAIRLFLFIKNTAFIIAADEDMIRIAVKEYFKGSNEQHQIDYLDKLIQVPIRVPQVGEREVRAYLFMLYAVEQDISADTKEKLRQTLEQNLRSSWKENPTSADELLKLFDEAHQKLLYQPFHLAERIAHLLATAPQVQGNPRIIKRLLNVVKMRLRTAKRRGMEQLDEALITKLVIFERCAGQEATSEFYNMIDRAKNGKPDFLQTTKNGKPKGKLPDTWSNDNIKPFIDNWLKLEPFLDDIDLRPAVYLSRETRSLGINASKLSDNAKSILSGLLTAKNMSSPILENNISTLLPDEERMVMEAIIDRLRQTSVWSKRPEGFSGACILADYSQTAAKLLTQFLKDLHITDIPWFKAVLKNKKWYNKEKA